MRKSKFENRQRRKFRFANFEFRFAGFGLSVFTRSPDPQSGLNGLRDAGRVVLHILSSCGLNHHPD